MNDYAWGVLTPFLAIAGLALALGAGWLMVAAARHLWGNTHYALMSSTHLPKNRKAVYLRGQQPADEEGKPEYLDAANKFRDALLQAPRMFTVAGLGWRVLLVRDTRNEPTDQE